MKSVRVVNQAISLMLAIMLLMVAGVRSWSDYTDTDGSQGFKTEAAAKGFAKKAPAPAGQDEQPELSALSLNAVITPAISFDFYQYLYVLPQPVWHFITGETVARITYSEPVFLISYFQRIFGRFVVTNAP